MGSRSHPHRVLSVCVWAGVCGCVWLRLIRSSWESSPLGYICSCHALSFVRSLQCLRSSFTVRSGSAIPEPCCFLDSDRRTVAAHCFPALPASALRKAPHLPTESSVSALRKAPHLPTESSVSAYGSSASALRKAPLLPTEAPPLPYGKLRLVSRCVLLPVIKLSFRNWILPSSLWQWYDHVNPRVLLSAVFCTCKINPRKTNVSIFNESQTLSLYNLIQF